MDHALDHAFSVNIPEGPDDRASDHAFSVIIPEGPDDRASDHAPWLSSIEFNPMGNSIYCSSELIRPIALIRELTAPFNPYSHTLCELRDNTSDTSFTSCDTPSRE